MKYMVMDQRNYIAAVLSNSVALRDFLIKVPQQRLENLSVKQTNCEYPFKIVELKSPDGRFFVDMSVFDGVTDKELGTYSKIVFRMEPLAIYTITEDFEGDPLHPGNDYMGKLDHEHLNEE